MNKAHPTTHAIASGLLGIKLPPGDRLAFIADHARDIADRHALPDRRAVYQAAVDGWDLAIRTTGASRAEIAASRRYEESDLRLIVTALVDDRVGPGWTFLWSLQNEGSGLLKVGALYPNGTASSFSEACAAAEREAAKNSKL